MDNHTNFAAALDILAATDFAADFAAEPDAKRNILAAFIVCKGVRAEVIEDLEGSRGGALGGEKLAQIAAAAFDLMA